MKKKLLVLTMATTMSLCAAPVFASDVTPEDLLKKMTEYTNSVESLSAAVIMNMDVDFTVASEGSDDASMNIAMKGDFDLKEIISPMTMSMTGTYKMELLGQTMDMSMEIYGAANEDETSMDTYVKAAMDGEDSGWVHQQTDLKALLESFGVSSFKELSTLDMEQMLGGVELNWTVEEADDKYTLSSSLNFADLMPLIKDAIASEASAEEIPEEVMTMIENVLGAFTCNMTYVIDGETYAPISAHVDFNDSDIAALNDTINTVMALSGSGDAAPSFSIDKLGDFSIDMDYTYDDVSEILIPAEALATEVTDPAAAVTE